MEYIAFFDLDHTILSINSGEALLKRGYRKGLVSAWQLLTALILTLIYKLHLVDPLKLISISGKWLAGVSVAELEELCNEIAEKDLIPVIRPEMILEINRHRENGAELVLLSSALSSICHPVAKHLGLDAVLCSLLEEKNRKYTGRPIGQFCFREEKLVQMKAYLKARNSMLESSFYYGDSMDDLPVLLAIGHPVCVSPDKRLQALALKKGWKVLNEGMNPGSNRAI